MLIECLMPKLINTIDTYEDFLVKQHKAEMDSLKEPKQEKERPQDIAKIRAWQKQNYERVKELARNCYHRNKGRRKAKNKEYYEANKEYFKEKSKINYLKKKKGN